MKKSMETLPLVPQFQKFLTASKTGRRLGNTKKRLTKGSIEQYQCILQLLKAFEQGQDAPLRIVLLKKQTVSTIKKEKKYWSVFFRQFSLFLNKDKNCFDQYVASVYKVLRSFFNYLLKELHLPVGNFHLAFRVSVPLYIPVVLEPWQLQFLIRDRFFESSLPLHLQRTKDLFVFGCIIGLRYADLTQLTKQQLITNAQGAYLQVYTRKTGTLVKLPLPRFLLSIVEKYRRKAGRYLLPRLSNTNLNLQVKDLGERAGWIHPLPKFRHRQGKLVELKNKNGKSLRFCDQLSAHTMRRTAITTLLTLGVPEQAVRKISGHAPGSKEFYRYISLAEDYVQRHVRKAYDRLNNEETIRL